MASTIEPIDPPAGRPEFGKVLLLCAVTVAAYLPALRAGFAWDDDMLVTRNALITSASGLHRIWFTTQSADYWPVTLTAFWVQWRLWGMHALGYHAVNLALHIAESLMLWRLFRRLGLARAFLGAVVFAVHPVNVESVAWISELKNLMAMLFFLASAGWFLDSGLADREPARRVPCARGFYLLSLGAFALAMLSKGSAAVEPLILAGLVAWRRKFLPGDLLRLAPFLALGAILAGVDIWFQRHGTGAVFRSAGPLERILGAGAVVWTYLGHAVWPVNLAFVYPEWKIRAGDPLWWIPLLAAAGLTLLLWLKRGRWSRRALFGWGFFCVALAPAMGFTDVYFMKYSLVADRYEHLAMIAIAGMIAGAGFSDLGFRLPRLPIGRLAAAALVAVLAVLTYRQCGTFGDARTLFQATLERNPRCWLAYEYLGSTPPDWGTPAGIAELEKALEFKPDYAEAHYNIGISLEGEGRRAEALQHFRESIRLDPRFPDSRSSLGNLLRVMGRPTEAAVQIDEALRLAPDFPEAHFNKGILLAGSGRIPEAIAQYREAVRLNPSYVEARNSLGSLLQGAGMTAEAIVQFQEAIRLSPGGYEAENNLGIALLNSPGRLAEAIAHFEAAERVNPESAVIQANLGYALAAAGRVSDAILHDEVALRLEPGNPAFHTNLGGALLKAGRRTEAEGEFAEAARLRSGR